MPSRPGALGKALTLGAALVLGFDGAVVASLGAWTGRPLLVAFGIVLFGAGGLVLWSWRGQRRRLDEIAAARRELRDEARALRDIIRNN
jgi:Flp pilus assembly protein TadB